MKLYTNGCSFTHGHKDHTVIPSPDGLDFKSIKKDAPWAWPRMLEPHFDEVVNEAWSGGSNERVFRRSIEFLSQIEDPSDWVVILQFTNLDRSEWFDSISNTWIGQLNHRLIYDDKSWNKRGINRDMNRRKGEQNIRHRGIIGTDLQILQTFLMRLIAFESFCESKGFTKILYTSMSANAGDLTEIFMGVNGKDNELNAMLQSVNETDRHMIDALVKRVRTDRVVFPIARITRDCTESETDGHPNRQGHRIFAEYIFRQLRDKGIIVE